MEVRDMLIAVGIVAAAFYLLYHSVWKKKGHCQGCSDGGCGSGKPPAGKK
jgi:hypothetical protein